MAYVPINKNFDVRTLEILMRGVDIEVKELIKRNVSRFKDAHLTSYAENLDKLNILTREYEQKLKENIEATMKRLASTYDGQNISDAEAAKIFKDTIAAVDSTLGALEPDIFFGENLSSLLEDEFIHQKKDARSHFSMFVDQYENDLDVNTPNYMKKYINVMIGHGYIFEKESQRYSLLVFLSFYEAYVKRIVGLCLLSTFDKDHRGALKKLIQSEDSDERKEAENVLEFVEGMKVPLAKSCYFSNFQKWFKGDISEFIERFLISSVDEAHSIPYQKKTLLDKKMLKSKKCSDMVEPPITIPSPTLIDNFFLLRDSRYMIM